MHNYMCNNKTEMKTIVYIYRKCVFLFIKKKMKTVGKTPYQQSVYLFIYYNKKNINEKFQKKLNKSTLRGGTYLPLLYFNFRVIKFICKKTTNI